MQELFKETDIDYRPLSEYVSWFIDESSDCYNYVQLPPIQRNSVWNADQIEKLWDSVLRGFPIGSFLLSPREKGSTARLIDSREQKKSDSEGYFLLDGQQRTRALLLGFKPNKGESRLWIDLNPDLSFFNAEHKDRQFLLRLITKYQPWGMDNQNPKANLNEAQKYDARKELYNSSFHYDYNVKINTKVTEIEKEEKFSWPVRAKFPVPFDAFVNLCGGTKGRYIEPDWKEVLELIPRRFKVNSDPAVPDHYQQILKALKPLIDNTDNNKDKRAVAFLKQNLDFDKLHEQEDSQSSMEVLFRRINSNGAVLAGEEMAYSILKSSWDKSYDLVSEIVNDSQIGYLFTSTGVVMAAARISRFNLKFNDNLRQLTGANFRKWIGEKNKEGKHAFREEMIALMDVKNDKSIFHQIMERFCNLALYRIKDDINDAGIPKKLLLSIPPTLIHPVLIWLYLNKDAEDKDEDNRKNILRYLIFCLLGLRKDKDNNKDEASKKAIEIIRNDHNGFPDALIYKQWIDDKSGIGMKIPRNYPFAKNSANGLLKSWNEIIGDNEDEYKHFRFAFWYKKELLLWFQRSYHAKWFDGYNPMSNDAYDTPYDYDHILPKSHISIQGSSLKTDITDPVAKKHFEKHSKDIYINSIGNYRAWPGWANRSDNNKCHTVKLRMDKDKVDEYDDTAKTLELESDSDFLVSSAIDESDKDLWKDAGRGGDVRDWPEKRRKAWQQAVENRVLYLYQIFYDTFEFEYWDEINTLTSSETVQ